MALRAQLLKNCRAVRATSLGIARCKKTSVAEALSYTFLLDAALETGDYSGYAKGDR
jgi:hypothetical protein